MNKLLFVTVLALASISSAAGFKMVTRLSSENVNGAVKYTLTFNSNGTVEVVNNPNSCSPSGACTELGVTTRTVRPVVVRDDRPRDGGLEVQLEKGLNLVVGEGRNGTSYYLHVSRASTDLIIYPLSLSVDAVVTK